MREMKAIGLDIGTTSISAMVMDAETGAVLETQTAGNAFWVPGEEHERVQDARRIAASVEGLLGSLSTVRPQEAAAIGITGQMHGIVYLDGQGVPVSPLFTWQDGRGAQEMEPGTTYAAALQQRTGYAPLSTGYGMVTHFYNHFRGLVPKEAKVFCTIGDYIAMRLAGQTVPLVHPSNAASMGVYAPEKGGFDEAALAAAGLDASLLPQVAEGFALAGRTPAGVPIAVAIGDNQASFLGAVRDMQESLLVNVGTGGQISLATRDAATTSPLIEARPGTGNRDFILAGSALCGGSSYALLEGFLAQAARLAGGAPGPLYDAMDRLALESMDSIEPLEVSTLFLGTRQDPALRGSIRGIGLDNFTPQHLILGFLQGMAQEYHTLYRLMALPADRVMKSMVCSGNGVRKNRPLQRMMEKQFGLPLLLPAHKEEGCFGAILFALVAAGVYPDIHRAQALIRYQGEN